MLRRPPRSTRTDTLFPYTTLFRSLEYGRCRWSSWAKIAGVNAGKALDGFTIPVREIAEHHLKHPRLHVDLRDYVGLIFESAAATLRRSEEHTSELQSLMRISYAVFCLKKKKHKTHKQINKFTTKMN